MNRSGTGPRRGDQAAAMARLRELTDRPLGPRRRRVQLAVVYLGAVTALAATMAFASEGLVGSIMRLMVLAAVVALWVALRRSTRMVTEAPDEVLDELLIRLRQRFFVDAYRFLGLAATLIGALLLTAGGAYGISVAAGAAAGWTLIALALGLPAVVAACQLPDADGEP